MKIRENYTCPLELTHDIIRGKWKSIMQQLGIDFMIENGQEDILAQYTLKGTYHH